MGSGTYVRGDGVALYALLEEGYLFAGWFDSQGRPVAADPVFEFTAREDRALTVLFIEPAPSSLTNYVPKLR